MADPRESLSRCGGIPGGSREKRERLPERGRSRGRKGEAREAVPESRHSPGKRRHLPDPGILGMDPWDSARVTSPDPDPRTGLLGIPGGKAGGGELLIPKFWGGCDPGMRWEFQVGMEKQGG